MSFLSFPDLNVWLALLMADHVHRATALRWWDRDDSDSIVFCRITQLGVLRLLTTSAAMNGKPLTMSQAWKAYDRLFADPRVGFLAEPASVEEPFRTSTTGSTPSPKLWADAYLCAFASRAGAAIVTFDKALAARSSGSLLLK